MPVMVCSQNIIRSYVEVLFGVKKQSFCHILKNFVTQSVISVEYELRPKAEKSKTKKSTWKYYLGTLLSYAAYITLPIIVLCALEYVSTNKVVCGPFKPTTRFLLDSEVELANNLTLLDLYEQRKKYGKSHKKWHDWSSGGGLLWDDYGHERRHNYMPLNNIKDFIDQFNFVGFHDICNSFDETHIEQILEPTYRKKGIRKLVPGYAITNSTGQDNIQFNIKFYQLNNISCFSLIY